VVAGSLRAALACHAERIVLNRVACPSAREGVLDKS
jgi:hypothetical protein